MASLANQTISSTYDGLIKTSTDAPVGVSGVQLLEDGSGNSLALSVGRANNGVTITGNLAVDTNTLYVDAANNRVGIGTSSPDRDLTVIGDAHIGSSTCGITLSDNSGVASIYGLDAAGTTYKPIELRTGAAGTGFYQDTSGNVGIGASPSSKLTVFEAGASGIATVDISGGASGAGSLQISAGKVLGTTSFDLIQNSSGAYVYQRDSNPLIFGTANTERMRIDSSGNVGIGTSSPYSTANHTALTIDGTSVSRTEYRTGGTSRARFLAISTSVNLGSTQDIPLIFETGSSNTERMRIDSSGNVGINQSNPSAYSSVAANNLVIGDASGNKGLTISSGTTGFGNIAFADGTATADQYRGLIQYGHTANSMNFFTNTAERMRIDSSGNVGIGESVPLVPLHISKNTASGENIALILDNNNTTANSEVGLLFRSAVGSTNTDFQISTINTAANQAQLVFRSDGGTERMRIDSSGNVGIGVTPNTSYSRLQIKATDSVYALDLIGRNAGTENEAQITFWNSAQSTVQGYITQDNGNMLFGAGLGASERMRITSGGYLKVGRTTATESRHLMNTSANGNTVLDLEHDTSLSSQPYGLNIDFRNVSPDNNTNWFHRGEDSTAVRFYIYSDGDVWTSDAGTLTSDETLKNNITDATPKLDDVMNLRVRNYYWNEDYHPNKTDKKLIGFVAQEFEEVFPHLVSEHIVKDEEVAEDGTVIQEAVYKKGIKEGKLIPILVKAMQEQQEIINDLKARIETLENN